MDLPHDLEKGQVLSVLKGSRVDPAVWGQGEGSEPGDCCCPGPRIPYQADTGHPRITASPPPYHTLGQREEEEVSPQIP